MQKIQYAETKGARRLRKQGCWCARCQKRYNLRETAAPRDTSYRLARCTKMIFSVLFSLSHSYIRYLRSNLKIFIYGGGGMAAAERRNNLAAADRTGAAPLGAAAFLRGSSARNIRSANAIDVARVNARECAPRGVKITQCRARRQPGLSSISRHSLRRSLSRHSPSRDSIYNNNNTHTHITALCTAGCVLKMLCWSTRRVAPLLLIELGAARPTEPNSDLWRTNEPKSLLRREVNCREIDLVESCGSQSAK
jgi:hypothetical protein